MRRNTTPIYPKGAADYGLGQSTATLGRSEGTRRFRAGGDSKSPARERPLSIKAITPIGALGFRVLVNHLRAWWTFKKVVSGRLTRVLNGCYANGAAMFTFPFRACPIPQQRGKVLWGDLIAAAASK